MVAHHSTNLASVLEQLGRREQAERWLADALEECGRLGEPGLEANTLATLGNLQVRDGRLDDAVSSYERALVLLRGAGHRRTEGIVRQGLGNVHRIRGDREAATEAYASASAIHREVGNRRHDAILDIERGRLALDADDGAEARRRAQAALEALGTTWDPRDLGLARQVLAAGHRRDGDLEGARTAWVEAWLDEPTRASLVARSMLRAEEGRILLADGDLSAAESALGEAAAMLAPIDRLARASTLVDHAAALIGLGRRAPADLAIAEAAEIADRARIGEAGELRRALARVVSP